WSAPLLLGGGALLLGWAMVRGGGLRHILSESVRLQTSHVPFWRLFPAAFIGVAVTSATIVLFGEAIWDPVALIARIGSAPVIIFGALIVLLAQLTTNMAANVVSPANDFSSLAPRQISYV